MIRFIDTHSHLYDSAFSQDADSVIERAVQAGVEQMILPDIDSSVREAMIALARRHPEHCHFCIGLHPTEINAENFDKEMQAVLSASLLHKDEMVAIGEIGLDYYWSKEFVELQQKAFKEQILLADSLDKPILIHCREAIGDCLNILQKYKGKNTRGVFHAYSGSLETYHEIKKLGNFLLGIGGVVSFKNTGLAKIIENVDLEDIILETDAPYLTPVPYRGKRNESAYIPLIAKKIAEIKGVSVEEVAQHTSSNASKMFFGRDFLVK